MYLFPENEIKRLEATITDLRSLIDAKDLKIQKLEVEILELKETITTLHSVSVSLLGGF
jgi:hypothetical protein